MRARACVHGLLYRCTHADAAAVLPWDMFCGLLQKEGTDSVSSSSTTAKAPRSR